MASFIRMPYMLVFHQSKCINAINRILSYYFHVYILEFIMYLCVPYLASHFTCGSEDVVYINTTTFF